MVANLVLALSKTRQAEYFYTSGTQFLKYTNDFYPTNETPQSQTTCTAPRFRGGLPDPTAKRAHQNGEHLPGHREHRHQLQHPIFNTQDTGTCCRLGNLGKDLTGH